MASSVSSNPKNEKLLYDALRNAGLNNAAACGIMANVYAENSGFQSDILEIEAQNTLSMTSDTYSSKADTTGSWPEYGVSGYMYGKYYSDLKSRVGYGLIQWTYFSRKDELLKYAKDQKESVSSFSVQIGYLLKEIATYKDLWNQLLLNTDNSVAGAEKAALLFCRDFEKPANLDTAIALRQGYASSKFWPLYGNAEASPPTLGQRIVQYAREYVQSGVKYKYGARDPDQGAVDCSGLVQHCYNKAGFQFPNTSAQGIYDTYINSAKQISPEATNAADLLLYNEGGLYNHIALANGSGGRIHAANTDRGLVEDNYLGDPDIILRVLSDNDTSPGLYTGDSSGSTTGSSIGDYIALTTTDPYAEQMKANLSRVEKAEFKYGYLIDMTHGEEFKFYIPEFSEQAGSNWSPIDIKGRSVTIKSYQSTNSRYIDISLDLYAGVGLYKAIEGSGESGKDTISRMHKDAFFVKSLEYPDYTTAITEPPPVVHLILGSAINIAGVVSDVVVQHMKPYDDENRAFYLKLSFRVTQTAINPIDYRDVRDGQYALLDTSNLDTMFVNGLGISDIANNQDMQYAGTDDNTDRDSVYDNYDVRYEDYVYDPYYQPAFGAFSINSEENKQWLMSRGIINSNDSLLVPSRVDEWWDEQDWRLAYRNGEIRYGTLSFDTNSSDTIMFNLYIESTGEEIPGTVSLDYRTSTGSVHKTDIKSPYISASVKVGSKVTVTVRPSRYLTSNESLSIFCDKSLWDIEVRGTEEYATCKSAPNKSMTMTVRWVVYNG